MLQELMLSPQDSRSLLINNELICTLVTSQQIQKEKQVDADIDVLEGHSLLALQGSLLIGVTRVLKNHFVHSML